MPITNKVEEIRPMFWNTIGVLFETFREHIVLKMSLFGIAVVAQVTGFLDLFATPGGYYYSLLAMMGFDTVSKIAHTLYHQPREFSLDILVRKLLYKCTIYFVICMAFSAFSNQWEGGENRLQWAGYIGLCVLEILSMSRRHKLIGYFVAFGKQVVTGKMDLEKLAEEADKYNLN